MKQYINKDALVAEILKRKKEAESNCGGYKSYDEHRCNACIVDFYEEFLEIINTLEVKDVDLDKEIKEEYLKHRRYGVRDNMLVILNELQFNKIAKHFFELGLKAQKG